MRAKDLAGQGFTGAEIQRKRKDGTPIELSVSTAPLHNKTGEVLYPALHKLEPGATIEPKGIT